MTWRPIDFNGIIYLNRTTIDQLQVYLDNKEWQLARVLLNSIHPFQSFEAPPSIAMSPYMPMKLPEAVEALGKQIRQLQQSKSPLADTNDWRLAAEKINKGLWEYLEVIEECITELFQQLSLLGIEDWKSELVDMVFDIKEILVHHLEDLQWKMKRIETQLQEYRSICEKTLPFWKKISLPFSSLLDRALYTNVRKSRKYLEFQYQNFSSKYKHFNEIYSKTAQKLEKFNQYTTFNQLDDDSQEKLKKIYQLTKIWELNSKSRFLPRNETIRALRGFISPEKALTIFKDYYKLLQKQLFTYGNLIKRDHTFVTSSEKVEKMEEELLTGRGELHTLGVTANKYRDFLLKTDPNPYVRSRLGFPEWIVGPEPHQTKVMRSLSYDIENLDGLYEKFRQAMERKSVAPDTPITELDGSIQKILHEMSQPLMSKSLMQLQVDRLINLLQQFDELTNINEEIVPYMGQVLGKALRADWKYNVLFTIPAFHDVYETHHGLVGAVDDRQHLNRMQKFKRYIQQIEQWIKDNDTPKHTHEIELDMNDIKGYLQDFLGQVQRLASPTNEKEPTQKEVALVENELLEYRYLFGNFFSHLRDDHPEERMIRRQFLFVDQYFEAVENKINGLSQRYRMETS